MRFTGKRSRLLLLLVLVGATVSGCAGARPVPTVSVPGHIPPDLRDAYSKVMNSPSKDVVMHQLNYASEALAKGHLDIAKGAFDQALASISSVFSDSEGAAKARSLWYSEGQKDYKGEPYERAMAFYYRGMLYAIDGEYDNARAAFKSGLLQDAFAEEEQKRADVALLVFLQKWTSQVLNDKYLTEVAHEELKKLRKDAPAIAPGSKLIVIETGTSPRKLSDGLGHWELVYRRGKGLQPIEVHLVQSQLTAYPMEDIYWQASTRGGRFVDKILKGKAQFREDATDFGTGMSHLSRVVRTEGMVIEALGDSQTGGAMRAAGAALGIVSAGSLMLAMNANPEADTRYWGALPDMVHVLVVPKNRDVSTLSWKVVYEDGYSVTVPVASTVVAKNENLEWYRVPHTFRMGKPK